MATIMNRLMNLGLDDLTTAHLLLVTTAITILFFTTIFTTVHTFVRAGIGAGVLVTTGDILITILISIIHTEDLIMVTIIHMLITMDLMMDIFTVITS